MNQRRHTRDCTTALLFLIAMGPSISASASVDPLLDEVFATPVEVRSVADQKLNDQRGKFIDQHGSESFFGVRLSSHVEDALGQVIDVSVGVSASRIKDKLSHKFERNVRYSRKGGRQKKLEANDATPNTPHGLDTADGFVQSIIVGGNENDVHQRADINVLQKAPKFTPIGDQPSVGTGQVTHKQNASVTITSTIESGHIGLNVTLPGIGTVKQSIKNGHVGQHVSLAHDGAAVRQNLEILTGPLPSLEQRGSRTLLELMRGFR